MFGKFHGAMKVKKYNKKNPAGLVNRRMVIVVQKSGERKVLWVYRL